MKALIVAAGKGIRINGIDIPKPKPLYQCNGKVLIEHVITRLAEAGVQEFYIVVGFMKEQIKDALGDGSSYGVSIQYIDNDDYEKANGLSVYKAKGIIGEPFFLSMADHIFQQQVVTSFVQSMQGMEQNVLCTDFKIETIGDIDDATKVLQEKGKIIKIHKKLAVYNSIDCGLFYLTSAFFVALEKAQQQGDYSITGGVQELAKEQQMFTYDIRAGRWMDIDTRQELAKVESDFQKIFKDIAEKVA